MQYLVIWYRDISRVYSITQKKRTSIFFFLNNSLIILHDNICHDVALEKLHMTHKSVWKCKTRDRMSMNCYCFDVKCNLKYKHMYVKCCLYLSVYLFDGIRYANQISNTDSGNTASVWGLSLIIWWQNRVKNIKTIPKDRNWISWIELWFYVLFIQCIKPRCTWKPLHSGIPVMTL